MQQVCDAVREKNPAQAVPATDRRVARAAPRKYLLRIGKLQRSSSGYGFSTRKRTGWRADASVRVSRRLTEPDTLEQMDAMGRDKLHALFTCGRHASGQIT